MRARHRVAVTLGIVDGEQITCGSSVIRHVLALCFIKDPVYGLVLLFWENPRAVA